MHAVCGPCPKVRSKSKLISHIARCTRSISLHLATPRWDVAPPPLCGSVPSGASIWEAGFAQFQSKQCRRAGTHTHTHKPMTTLISTQTITNTNVTANSHVTWRPKNNTVVFHCISSFFRFFRWHVAKLCLSARCFAVAICSQWVAFVACWPETHRLWQTWPSHRVCKIPSRGSLAKPHQTSWFWNSTERPSNVFDPWSEVSLCEDSGHFQETINYATCHKIS